MNFTDTRAQRVSIDGYDARRDEDLTFLQNVVSPDYFRTLRIGLRSGRPFEERDDEKAAPVVMVNNTFAERFWGGRRRTRSASACASRRATGAR